MIELQTLDFLTVKAVQAFKRNNINTVEDLLYHYPTRYNDYTIVSIGEAELNTTVTVAGICLGKANVVNVKSNLSVMNFYVEIDNQKVRVTIFNRHFLRNKIHYGKWVRLTGKFDGKYNKFVAAEISFDEISNAINPVFNIKGLNDKKVLEIKERLFFDYGDKLVDDLPLDLQEVHDLISIHDAIKYINIPETIEQTTKAIYRIKFEELLKYQLKVKYMLYMRKKNPKGIAIKYNREKIDVFIKSLPYELTVDQKKCLKDILNDISSRYKMNRLLQGEVGSGKTVVAAIAIYAIVTAGYQGAIMVPTEVLVQQHYKTFTSLFNDLDLNIATLTSSITTKKRNQVLENLQNGQIDIIIGTHSLFQNDVEFENLGLVVTDEEHRFGVRQRVSMVGKGYLIDHLKMSATPIPRTLAISYLGDNDISSIQTLPGAKKPVITKYVDYSKRLEVFDHIGEQIKSGRQVYIITPMIDSSEAMDLKNALEVYKNTKNYYNDLCDVGLIHGKLSNEEKEKVMLKFSKNEIGILVATSVIEVGVNIINATTMVILDADRFGIAQLHQMRGRVRRSDYQAYCYLISKSEVESAVKRLKLIEQETDGFALAEEDLLIRGSGDIFGEKQTGNIDFKMANIVIDKDLLNIADKAAEKLINSDKFFNKDEYKNLLELVHNNYEMNKEILE